MKTPSTRIDRMKAKAITMVEKPVAKGIIGKTTIKVKTIQKNHGGRIYRKIKEDTLRGIIPFFYERLPNGQADIRMQIKSLKIPYTSMLFARIEKRDLLQEIQRIHND